MRSRELSLLLIQDDQKQAHQARSMQVGYIQGDSGELLHAM
jgi:hypothetical protein